MCGVADQQGSADSGSGHSPSRAILYGVGLACLLLFGLALAGRAEAGALYRCIGASGETAYSTSPDGFRQCRKVQSFGSPAPARGRTAPVRRTSLTLATAAVATTARSLEADGAAPTSLAHVQGNAQTDARSLAAAGVRRAALANAAGAVTTTARAVSPIPQLTGGEQAPGPTAPGQAAPAATGPPSWEGTGSSPPLASAGATVRRGAVYRVVRADGSVEYTNVRPAGSRAASDVVTMLFTYIATCAACDLHSPIQWNRVPLNLTAYAQAVHAASAAYGVDEAFLRAVIHAESAFNPRAMSIKGAQGLMQLMPGTASDLGVMDAFDSDQNIRGGARYLGLLLQDFDGDEQLAAAAYNAGPAAVQRYGGVPPYAETRVYVQRVATLRRRYAAAIHPALTARAEGTASSGL